MTESDLETVVAMQAVYRMYSTSGRLLYVGVTSNWAHRFSGHAEKRWFPLVANITLQWFPDRETAERAERTAIENGQPRMNIVRRSAKEPPACMPAPGETPDGPLSLAEAVGMRVLQCTLSAARKASQRPGFPAPVGMRGPANLYDVDALCAYKE